MFNAMRKTNMRINVRLDASSEQAFEYLKQNAGQNVTPIIKHSLELYINELQSVAGDVISSYWLIWLALAKGEKTFRRTTKVTSTSL